MKCYAVREAGTVNGKQSLKLNVYPGWTNCFELCVNAGLRFLHTYKHLYFLTEHFSVFALAVDLTTGLKELGACIQLW